MKYHDMTLGQIEAVVNKLGGMERVKDLLSNQLIVTAKGTIEVVLTLTVDYDRPVEEGVRLGKYGWTHEEITSANFPTNHRGAMEVKIKLVKFYSYVRPEDVLFCLYHQLLRPANLPELLALGEKHPELPENINFPIIALGSCLHTPNKRPSYAGLKSLYRSRERHLSLYSSENVNQDLYFAAV